MFKCAFVIVQVAKHMVSVKTRRSVFAKSIK